MLKGESPENVCAFIWTCPMCDNVQIKDNSLEWTEPMKIYICIVEISMKSLISRTAPIQ